jgi:DNA-binding response OmpR family regulator
MTAAANILIVDDEAGIRFFLEETLKRDGHRVVAVESGEAALEAMATQEFDLALIDLKLPGIGGLDVLAHLRQQSPDTAAIMLTAYASLDTAVEALRQGAHDYLFKPCKTVELRESIRTGLLKSQRERRQRALLAQLEQSLATSLAGIRTTVGRGTAIPLPTFSEPETEQMRFLQRGGLIVDLMRHVITLDGHLLQLSPTEFDLLAYLVSEAPRVVSPQELVREVQGYETEAWEASNTIRYHVYRIRRKMRSVAGCSDAIRTVRGVGYTIDE